MAGRGRQPKLTPELSDQICRYIASGLTKKGAVDAACVSQSSLYLWLEKGERDKARGKKTVYSDFLESLRRAEGSFKMGRINTIRQASSDDWRAAAWLLERCYRDEYGKSTMDINLAGQPGGEPIKTENAVQIYLPDNLRGDNRE